MKSFLFTLTALIIVTVTAFAAAPVGDWQVHNNFSHDIHKVI